MSYFKTEAYWSKVWKWVCWSPLLSSVWMKVEVQLVTEQGWDEILTPRCEQRLWLVLLVRRISYGQLTWHQDKMAPSPCENRTDLQQTNMVIRWRSEAHCVSALPEIFEEAYFALSANNKAKKMLNISNESYIRSGEIHVKSQRSEERYTALTNN